ncbi:MAG: Xaa-Pro peptidase family protein [Tepidisphaeraceae bacterium]
MSDTTAREAALYFQQDFPAAELTARRAKVLSHIGDGLAVLAGATEVLGFDPIRQNNDFYYLAGIDVPHAYLTLDGATGRCVLYLPPRDEKHENSDGPSLSADDGDIVLRRTGIDEVRPTAKVVDDLTNVTRSIWLMRAPGEGYRQCQDTLRHYHKRLLADPLDGRLSRETHLMARIAQLSPRADFRDLSLIVHRLRLTKSPLEADVMRRSAKITALACLEAIKATKPGVYEYQLAALSDYFFQVNGAQGAGYRPIIATGANIWMMHYWRNNAACKAGDLVIWDYAPDYNNYTSDIGRMWPVNGTYSSLQRELYGFVLEHHRVLLSLIRPKRTKDEILAEAAEQMRPVIEKTRWSKPIYRNAALKLLESKRPLSHGVGMSVHEATEWASRPIEAGLVFAVDPELFIPEERTYIRVEDTVLVTESGIENLTVDCPREMDEVERVMKQGGGILQAFPAVNFNPSR